MRIVCISDTHCMLDEIAPRIPDGDLLVHCGDLTWTGEPDEIRGELAIMAELPHPYKLFVAGNHDRLFENNPSAARGIIAEFPGIQYLQDSGCIIDGVRCWGSPWQPYFQGNPHYRWVFNFPDPKEGRVGPFPATERGETEAALVARSTWARIPDDTHVLITHGPPRGILDQPKPSYDPRCGCPYLRERVEQLASLRLHAFGHIHGSYGRVDCTKRTFVNAAINNEYYMPVNAPIVVDLDNDALS